MINEIPKSEKKWLENSFIINSVISDNTNYPKIRKSPNANSFLSIQLFGLKQTNI